MPCCAGEFARYLVDEQMFWQYKRNSECRLDTYCNTLKLLDNERVLSSHDDFFLRIFIIHTGQFGPCVFPGLWDGILLAMFIMVY